MSLPIWIKLGTHSLGVYWLKSKRKYPEIGDIVEIKERFLHGDKWRSVKITERIYPERNDHFKADLL